MKKTNDDTPVERKKASSGDSRNGRKEEPSRGTQEKPRAKPPTDRQPHPWDAKPTHGFTSKKELKAMEPALVVEITKHTGKLEHSVGKSKRKSSKSTSTANTTARGASSTTTDAQPNNPRQKDSSGTALLAKAAIQTSSQGLPAPPLTLPLVTPPTLPEQSPTTPPSPKRQQSQQKRRGVPHTYRDHANEPDSPSFVRKKTGGVTKPFPEKLYEMLTKETETQDVVCWLPHGRAFIVRKPKIFTSSVMPKYFKQTKLTSFQRQLNLYGFRRITQGPDAGAYYHELFLQGRPQLCMRMQRQKVKGTGHKLPADAETEPNFYNMPSTTAAAVVESPGMQGLRGAANLLQGISAGLPPGGLLAPKPAGLRGAANLLQGISAGLPPAALSPKAATAQGSLLYTASTSNPQHWQYAAKTGSQVLKETPKEQGNKKERRTPKQKGKNGDKKKPPLEEGDEQEGQSQGNKSD